MRPFFATTLLAGLLCLITISHLEAAPRTVIYGWILNSSDDLDEANDPAVAGGIARALENGVAMIAIDASFYANAATDIQAQVRGIIHNFGRMDRMVIMLYSPTYPPGVEGQVDILGTDYANDAPRCDTWLVGRVVDQQGGDKMLCEHLLSKPPAPGAMSDILKIEATKMYYFVFSPVPEKRT